MVCWHCLAWSLLAGESASVSDGESDYCEGESGPTSLLRGGTYPEEGLGPAE